MNEDVLNVVFEEKIDRLAISNIKGALSFLGSEVEFHELPNKGVQASILLYTMSSIAVIFGGAFVKKLGEKSAEDFYAAVKKGLSVVYQKYFGANPEYNVVLIGSSEEKAKTSKYSLILSLYCVGKEGQRVKLLYDKDWCKCDFDKATQFYLSAMAEFVASGEGDIQKALENSSDSLTPSLLAWNEITGKLLNVDPLAKHM